MESSSKKLAHDVTNSTVEAQWKGVGRPHVLIEIAFRRVESVVQAATGDAKPRVQQASAAGDLRAGEGEESPATDQAATRGVDHGRCGVQAGDFRCASDSIHHTR
jgi:hypothetical protein